MPVEVISIACCAYLAPEHNRNDSISPRLKAPERRPAPAALRFLGLCPGPAGGARLNGALSSPGSTLTAARAPPPHRAEGRAELSP